jgi:AraC family transcriptional regulator
MEAMPDIVASELLKTQLVAIRAVRCAGFCRHQSDEEATRATHVVFPYRGFYIRHVGQDDAVADANQVLFFNAHEGYRVSHPVPGGDASLDLVVGEQLLDELMPRGLRRAGERVAFNQLRMRIDPRTQALVALLRHGLQTEIAETLEAESLALTLVRRALGPLTPRAPRASATRQRLVNRTKLVLAGDLARRWTLAEIAREVGHSPVYLTQVFHQVEGLPLYRYHMRLRLARSLHLLSQYDDLTALSLDLGFYSHSHFTTAFKQTYGRPPSAFRLAGPHRQRVSRR